jgi:hypothetical protein
LSICSEEAFGCMKQIELLLLLIRLLARVGFAWNVKQPAKLGLASQSAWVMQG